VWLIVGCDVIEATGLDAKVLDRLPRTGHHAGIVGGADIMTLRSGRGDGVGIIELDSPRGR
jgi:hypothetical protein